MSITQETRRESYDKTLVMLGPQLRKVFGAVVEHGPVSAWQLSAILKREVYQLRPRLTDLAAMGLIKATGTRHEDYTDRNEAVWNIVDGQLPLV
jgi:predicted transcriptional regulator